MDKFELASYGVRMISQILDIPEPNVMFFDKDEAPNKHTVGGFIAKLNAIAFNSDWVLASEPMQIIISCFHETRHAYQFYSVKHQINESQETLNKWEQEFNNYIQPININNEGYDELYLEQEIELDALIFTHKKIKELFGIKTVLPDFVSKLL